MASTAEEKSGASSSFASASRACSSTSRVSSAHASGVKNMRCQENHSDYIRQSLAQLLASIPHVQMFSVQLRVSALDCKRMPVNACLKVTFIQLKEPGPCVCENESAIQRPEMTENVSPLCRHVSRKKGAL